MRFGSRRDLLLGLVVWVPIGGGFIHTLIMAEWVVNLVMMSMLLFVGWIWFGTNYHILDEVLKIYCGPLRWSIPIKDIKSIKRTRNPLSSAALSLKRLEIRYGHYSMILISPQDEERFIEQIKRRNPNIKITI